MLPFFRLFSEKLHTRPYFLEKALNEVSKVLHNMIRNEQCITAVYDPQSNGHCERQNRIIKDSLMKFVDGNPCDWPNIIKGVLLAHRVSKTRS